MRRWEEHLKGMVVPSTLFEEFGFHYIGPIDGHDLGQLVTATLRDCADRKGPQLLHVITRKGKGYEPAEADPVEYHAVSPFDPPRSACIKKPGASPATPRSSATGCATWPRATRACSRITPAMREGSGLVRYSQRVPRPLLRCRHRRAAQRDARGRHGLRGHEAGGGDLLHLPAARLRPADPRRRAAEPRRAVRDRSRRAGRAGRRDPRRQLRPQLPALHPQHGGDGAVRRGRVPADALHRVRAPGSRGGALPARQPAPAWRPGPR